MGLRSLYMRDESWVVVNLNSAVAGLGGLINGRQQVSKQWRQGMREGGYDGLIADMIECPAELRKLIRPELMTTFEVLIEFLRTLKVIDFHEFQRIRRELFAHPDRLN